MDPLNVREIEWALEGEDILERELQREAGEMLEQVSSDPSTFLADWQLPETDRAKLAETKSAEVDAADGHRGLPSRSLGLRG